MGDGGYLAKRIDWRDCFSDSSLANARLFVERGLCSNVLLSSESASGTVMGNMYSYRVTLSGAPTSYSDTWHPQSFRCSCGRWKGFRPSRTYVSCTTFTCEHEAAIFMLWEREHGPWIFYENEMDRQIRLAREEEERKIREYDSMKDAQKQQKCSTASWTFDMSGFNGPTYFDIPAIFPKDCETDLYAINSAKSFLTEGTVAFESKPLVRFDLTGSKKLECSVTAANEFDSGTVAITVERDRISFIGCSCQHDYSHYFAEPRAKHRYCGHKLAALSLLWDYIKINDPGDATDQSGEEFFRLLDRDGSFMEEAKEEKTEIAEEDKTADVLLAPRLLISGPSISLSFKIGRTKGKTYMLRSLREFKGSYEHSAEWNLGKDIILDFSKEKVTPDSQVWLDYIFDKVNGIEMADSKVSRMYGYSREITVKSSDDLTGIELDMFYKAAEWTEVEFENKEAKTKGTLRIAPTGVKLRLICDVLRQGGDPIGVTVIGEMPKVLKGKSDRYVLKKDCLGKLTDQEWASLEPFHRVCSKNGNISFKVGKGRLSDFFYRIVPSLIENPFIDFEDLTDGELAGILPPEPVFVFYLDYEDELVNLRTEVTYGDKVYNLGLLKSPGDGYRDGKQELRVREAIDRFFPACTPEGLFLAPYGDDAFYEILTDGLPILRKFGETVATDAFMRKRLRKSPKIEINISVESGLLDIGVLSKDSDIEELAGIYHSYKQKKRYHKLTDGSFVDLSECQDFDSIEDLAKSMNISVEELLSKNQNMPLFRALYLDYLLSEHERIAGKRDRTYRSLVKGFSTVKDSDFDVPSALEDTMRPYQVYGHKWIRTVIDSGFGGILADEMGLGKTLQTISVMLAMKNEGYGKPALVVCPASLVFNWEEEVKKFAPSLKVVPVSGTAGARKKLLAGIGTEGQADVYVTSYDLVRQDIDIYKEQKFGLMVLDEAQYIKNITAAMTKAVKIVTAEKRMALTGTPIENRLSELWSIFDFLMPGFLYSRKDFGEQFELPITKLKDPDATERLKKMVKPFILRRCKTDVLKDLPPKIEEVRYVRFEKKQREVYDAQVLKMKGLISSPSGKSGEDKIKMLAELTRIRQICCDPHLLFEDYKGESAKRGACIELIKNAIEGGHRILLFSQFTSMIALLEKDLKDEGIPFFEIKGDTPKDKRLKLVHDFNEGDTPVFVISLKAGGTGLNLTGADVVIHYDPWWNLAAQNQATDRAHRIGQDKTVTVYRLIVKDTIEEKILELQDAKKDLSDAVLSGDAASLMSLSADELLSIIS